MKYILKKTNITLEIDSLGAEMTSVVYKGKERLWQNENGTWNRHAPILFPHAGKCSIVVDGKHYPDQFHGFARDQEFELVSQTNNSVTLLLKSNEVSHETYPYDFSLFVSYQINDNEVTVTYKIDNPTKENIYFLLGCHESYALDSDVSNYYIEFDKDEDFESWNNKMNGKFKVGSNKVIDLSSKYLENAETIILENTNSKKVLLKRKSDNTLVAATTFNDFPNLLLWHPLGSKMICIEPWINLPDKEGDFEMELKDKKYTICVKPNESKEFVRTIAYF